MNIKLMNRKFKDYYMQEKIINRILPELQYYETAFIPSLPTSFQIIRKIRIVTSNDYKYRISDIYDKNLSNVFSFYLSLTTYKHGFPIYDFWEARHNIDYKQNYDKRLQEMFSGYDWLIDIDCPDYKLIKTAQEDVINIYKYLESKEFQIKEVNFSGRGFHVVIPYSSLIENKIEFVKNLDNRKDKNIYKTLFEFTKLLNTKLSELVDFGVNDSRRIRKVPDSLVYNPLKSSLVYKVVSMKNISEIEQFNYKKDAVVDIKLPVEQW